MTPGNTKVFISYSHKDEKWKDIVVTHLGVLERQGMLEQWNDRKIQAGDEWRREIETSLQDCQIAILLVSAHFLTSKFILEEEIPIFLNRRVSEGLKIFPLILRPCIWEEVKWLGSIQARPIDGKALSGMSEHDAESAIVAFTKEILACIKQLTPTAVPLKPLNLESSTPKYIRPFAKNIELSRLPISSTPLFGREKELELLDTAWEDQNTRILSFVAFGGVGKTALVNEWLNRMDAANFRGAVRVYGWSFYSQGTREDGQASADGFINDAIQWFGGNIANSTQSAVSNISPISPTASPFEKGRYLAQLIAQEPTLLVLDGLEPLQYPPGPMHGKLKDQAMQALLRGLSRNMNGLCVLSTRVEVEELKATKSRFTPVHELEQLSVPAGIQLLKFFELRGTKDDFENTVQELKGHALALNLLGSYLSTVHNGDLRQRDRIPALFAEESQGGHARRVMACYEAWFNSKPELEVLYLLGLFDRPVGMEVIELLKAEPAIPGLTDQVQNLSHAQWQLTLKHLRDAKLLNKDTDALDCHPLVREHFGEQIKHQYPDAWMAAHSRLYEYYKNLPKKELPDTLEEMEPLFLAVRHGCLAGLYNEAVYDVFWKRIRRENEQYSFHKLGAFGADLACLAHFFESVWDKPADLTEADKAVVLSWAGFDLRAVGRLAEAAQPMKVSLEIEKNRENYKGAAAVASNLSELLLTIGQIPAAIEYGQQSVNYADRSGVDFEIWGKRTYLANAYFQNGNNEKADYYFKEAEQLLKEKSGYEYLYSTAGFQYCELLLETGQVPEVLERTTYSIEIAKENNWLLDFALDLLSLAKAHFQQALQAAAPDFREAAHYLQQAVDGLRKAGQQHYLPLGLLAHAALYRVQGQYALAWEDLEEVLEIARYGGMRLFLVDYYLEAARVMSQQLGSRQSSSQQADNRKSVEVNGLSIEDYRLTENGETLTLSKEEMEAKYRDFVERAAALIKETGYHRRDGELAALRTGVL